MQRIALIDTPGQRAARLAGCALLAVCAWLPLAGCSRNTAATAGSHDGPAARPVHLQLPRLGGGRVSLAAHRGKPLVVFLFTTWSLRSQLEAPQFAQLHDRNKEIQLLGIALDRGKQAHTLVRTYVEYVAFDFDVALAQPDDLQLVSALGRTTRVPRTLLIDADGRIVQDHQGQTDFPRLFRVIRRLTATPPTR